MRNRENTPNFNDFIWIGQNGSGVNELKVDGLFTDSAITCHVFIIKDRSGKTALLHMDNCSNPESLVRILNQFDKNSASVIHAYNPRMKELGYLPQYQSEQTRIRCYNALYKSGVREIQTTEVRDGSIAVAKNGDIYRINIGAMKEDTSYDSKKILIGLRPPAFYRELQHDANVLHNQKNSSGYVSGAVLRNVEIQFGNHSSWHNSSVSINNKSNGNRTSTTEKITRFEDITLIPNQQELYYPAYDTAKSFVDYVLSCGIGSHQIN